MPKERNRSLKWRVTFGITLLVIAALIITRLYLATWLLNYVNNVLSHIQGYQGSVQSIHIDLYRGAYRIDKLVLSKTDGKIPTPFIDIDQTDLSVQWSGLLHGRVVSNIVLTHPVINFAVNKGEKQTGENVDWTKPIKDLMPIDIDYVRFKDGSITYQDFSSSPQVNIYVHQMNGQVTNLRNVRNGGNKLPSALDVQGSSIGNGKLKIGGRLDILKKIPDMNLLLSLDDVDLPALNNYTEAYAAFDFKSGTFDLYTHLVTQDGKVSGYVKPIITHLSVDVVRKPDPVEVAWGSIVAAVLEIFTNHSSDQFATQIDLKGDLNHVDTDSWSALWGILSNAYVNALSKGFNETHNGDVTEPKK